MTPLLPRPVVMPAAVLLSCLAGILLAAGGSAQLRAQEPSRFWNTSADAPAGVPPEAYSAPDQVTTFNRDEALDSPMDTPGPGTWRVTGAGLKPRENDVSYTVNSNGSCTSVTSGDAFTVWNAVPALPDGVVIDTLRMYYSDTSASNSTAWLTVYDLYGAIVQEWSVSTTGNIGNSFNDSVQIDHTVNYSIYSYLLNWRPAVTGSTMQLCGFRVFYTTPLTAPGAPQGLISSVNGRTVMLAWSAPATGGPASSYILEAGSAPGLANIVTTPVSGTSFVATGVPPGVYYVRVRAVNDMGTSPPTSDVVLVVS
jgi:hypothetical protein